MDSLKEVLRITIKATQIQTFFITLYHLRLHCSLRLSIKLIFFSFFCYCKNARNCYHSNSCNYFFLVFVKLLFRIQRSFDWPLIWSFDCAKYIFFLFCCTFQLAKGCFAPSLKVEICFFTFFCFFIFFEAKCGKNAAKKNIYLHSDTHLIHLR